jgi:uncharacterized protein (TIGR00106 family)
VGLRVRRDEAFNPLNLLLPVRALGNASVGNIGLDPLSISKLSPMLAAAFFVCPRFERREAKMPLCNVSLQIIPLVPEAEVYPTVDRVIELIKSSGVRHTVGPMETTMEGELDRLLEIVSQAQQVCVEAGAERILSVVKIDYSTKGVTIDEKVGKYR